MMAISAVIALSGIGLALYLYVQRRSETEARERQWLSEPGVFRVLHNKYYVDEAYDIVIVRPLRGLGNLLFGVDRIGVDGLVWLVTAIPRGLGFVVRELQRGAIQGYGLVMAFGIVLMLILALWS